MKLILLFDRLKNKIRKSYREYIFKCRTGCKVNLVGDITLINTNLKIGRNVTLYPGVMLFGDGRIEIGDNVDIGNNTIIYASKFGGGGNYRSRLSNSGTMLFNRYGSRNKSRRVDKKTK